MLIRSLKHRLRQLMQLNRSVSDADFDGPRRKQGALLAQTFLYTCPYVCTRICACNVQLTRKQLVNMHMYTCAL